MSSTTRSDGRALVALVATHNRDELLLNRAIPSILRQTCPPDRIIIVIDGDQKQVDLLEPWLREKCAPHEVAVLGNYRTRNRAAGAWNTAIDWMQRGEDFKSAPDVTYVAILDDDDAWAPDHLEKCYSAAIRGDKHIVIPGIIRHETPIDEGIRQDIPARLDPRECFIRNPHVQGSNLFLRLDALLKCGGFDEYLPSCTDRDLCIRLTELAELKVGKVDAHTVHHYADAREDRLSRPRSPAKLQGLTRFYKKHQASFDEEARRAFRARAKELFNWGNEQIKNEIAETPMLRKAPRHVHLVVGFATDASGPDHARELLDDLLQLKHREEISGLDVVVVENGPLPADGARRLRDLADKYRLRGLHLYLIGIEQQKEAWTRGWLPDIPCPGNERLPIAVTRTILAQYVGKLACERPGAWPWLLDDDKRLEVLVDPGNGQPVLRHSPDLATLCELQDRGIDIVLGPDTDAAPLPFDATIRTQLNDVLANLSAMFAMNPEDPWPDRRAENTLISTELRDSYYDLARTTEHLETRFWYHAKDCSKVGEHFTELAHRVQRILSGEQVTRPIMVKPSELDCGRIKSSAWRGGSAIFFKPEILLRIPNSILKIGSHFTRRSDTVVTRLMRAVHQIRSVMHPAAGVRHNRRYAHASLMTDSTLLIDVAGYAVSRAIGEVLKSRRKQDLQQTLSFTPDERRQILRRSKKYRRERLGAFTLSAHRIMGLAESIRTLINRCPLSWKIEHSGELEAITAAMDEILGHFKTSAIKAFSVEVKKLCDESAIEGMVSRVPEVCDRFDKASDSAPGALEQLQHQRELIGRSIVSTLSADELRLLGAGSESIVLTDGKNVYKVFDYWKQKDYAAAIALMSSLCSKTRNLQRLCDLQQFTKVQGSWVLVYPYEPSEEYAGGRGRELLELLQECRKTGIVCRNIHPKNLRVMKSGLKLIDYGSDLRPFNEKDFRSMAQRCWLTWRWHHRPDLADVMRRALTDEAIPELDGFDLFWGALDDAGAVGSDVADVLLPLILKDEFESLLDYGCGKAQLVRQLAAAGKKVIGFDPGPIYPARWHRDPPAPDGLMLTTSRPQALASAPCDAVICSLVLCELHDGDEYEHVLADLRRTVKENGKVHVAVCHPSFLFGGPTPLHQKRILPDGARYDCCFSYQERVAGGTKDRVEFHRPISQLRRDLLRHGLFIERTYDSQTIDLDRFEPAADFLILECRPLSLALPDVPVSLMIKTCVMEWRTIEQQVEHLVRQLETPRTFCERVLVVDSRNSAFVRQYDDGDVEKHKAAVERLRARRLVDRIVHAPSDPAEVRKINQTWFAIDSAATHTTTGLPTCAPLSGFEACEGKYILQVDADLMIGRRDLTHDYLGEMIAQCEDDPSVITVALNIAQPEDKPFTAGDGTKPWRVEVRGALMHRQRLLAARPLPNESDGIAPALMWHRSLDQQIIHGGGKSLRGGSAKTFFIHPPNAFKQHRDIWMATIDLIERGTLPPSQLGKVEIVGGFATWLGQERGEKFIFVVTGRNVAPSRMRRCLDSMLRQRRSGWGAVIADDGSDPLSAEYLREFVARHPDKFTLLQPRQRRGQLANTAAAIGRVCNNPESIVITLDLDDALIGNDVLDCLDSHYTSGADATVGSMLRTDKHKEYPPVLINPRRHRNNNVWQHLRTFKKKLFDAIPDHVLREEGRYFGIAVDWSFMLPIIESADSPRWIQKPLYLYEPFGVGKGIDHGARECQIERIVRRSPATKLSIRRLSPIHPQEIVNRQYIVEEGILLLRHAERPSFKGMPEDQRDHVTLTDAGRAAAVALGNALGNIRRIVSSPVLRCMMTAEAMAKCKPATDDRLVQFSCADRSAYETTKFRIGWDNLLADWIDGNSPPGILFPLEEVAAEALRAMIPRLSADRVGLAVGVTHDFLIAAVLAAVRGSRQTGIPYLGSVHLSWREAESFLNEVS